jgi:hypothetical protein
MIDLTIHVELDNGDKWSTKIKLSTIIKFERKYKISAAKAISPDGVYLEYMAWLAWEQTRRDGRTVPVFDKFVDEIDDLEVVNDAVPLDETA